MDIIFLEFQHYTSIYAGSSFYKIFVILNPLTKRLFKETAQDIFQKGTLINKSLIKLISHFGSYILDVIYKKFRRKEILEKNTHKHIWAVKKKKHHENYLKITNTIPSDSPKWTLCDLNYKHIIHGHVSTSKEKTEKTL